MSYKLLAGLLCLSLTVICRAADTEGARTETGKETQPEEKTEAPVSIEGAINTTNAYVFRGYNYIDHGYLIQPELTLSLNGLKFGEVTVSPYLYVWTNISEVTGPSGFWDHFNEIDVDPAVEIGWRDFTLAIQYNTNFFPSGIPAELVGLDGQGQEIGATLTWDDSAITKKVLPFALNPHVAYFEELEDRSDQSRDSYLEFGLEPTVHEGEKLTVTTPVTLGLSTDSFYVKDNGENEFLGYLSGGVAIKYQLTEHWDLHGSVEYVQLFSDILKDYNSGDWIVVGTIGVGFAY